MRVVLVLGANTFEFTPINSGGPFPLLIGVGPISIAARAGDGSGIGSNEVPTASFELDNVDNAASEIIGSPLRARASIYDDEGALSFTGLVASITFSKSITLNLQS